MAFCLGTLPWLVVAMGPGSDDPHAGWVEGTQLKVPESQADLQPKSYPLKQLLSRSQTTQLRTPALLLSGHTAMGEPSRL